MSVPHNNRIYHDEPISDSNHSADVLDDNWVDDGQDADVRISASILFVDDCFLLDKEIVLIRLFVLYRCST